MLNIDYTVFDALSSETLASLSCLTDLTPEKNIIPLGVTGGRHLLLVLAGLRKGCWIEYVRLSSTPADRYDCPIEEALSHTELPYTRTIETDVIGDRPRFARKYGDNIKYNYCISYEYFICTDSDAVTWFEEYPEPGSDGYDSGTFHRKIGLALGYPEPAITAFCDSDSHEIEEIDQLIRDNCGELEAKLLEFRKLVPYKPCLTAESIIRAAERGLETHRVVKHLADRYPELEPFARQSKEIAITSGYSQEYLETLYSKLSG